ncbi:hypothetical protein [uncultured Tenacibaculum sp.]|uniref:hypothetical protein n=1 Tax=uncultured Tenacibaculum sp. TaxID=174713 RepID=UPI0026294F90|nr:hypothetical protein [uncultured Tenacibaculum sp.]
MLKKVIFFVLFYSINLNSQTSKDSNHIRILEDGFYRANVSYFNNNILDTDITRRIMWVEVENDIIVYVGRTRTKSPNNNLLIRGQSRIVKMPYIRRKNKKIFAEYSLSTKVTGNNTSSGRNINYKVEIIQ